MNKEKKEILKVLVGSQAHGLADENSDYDYRAVYVLPTSQILSLGYKYRGNDWVEGEEDNTAYELGHFLQLATKCNPTILEVFRAPIVSVTDEGYYLRQLLPYVWNPKGVFDAFVGYGLNQRKKFLDKKDNRQDKYAVAYIRTLYNLIELLGTENFNVKISDGGFKDMSMRYKQGCYAMGEIIDLSELLIEKAKQALKLCKHEPDINKVNEYLLKIRQENW